MKEKIDKNIKKTKELAEEIANTKVKKTMDEYKSFAMKGNILDLAIGVVIGSAFTNIVNTLVSSTIMPVISLFTNKVDLSTLFIALNGKFYNTIAEAKATGAIVLEYGALLNAMLNFFIISFTLFLIVRYLNKVKAKTNLKDAEEKVATTKECPYCLSLVPIKAQKCAFCTSDLEEKKD